VFSPSLASKLPEEFANGQLFEILKYPKNTRKIRELRTVSAFDNTRFVA